MEESNARRRDARKAMAFDLFAILDERPEQQTLTVDEIKELIRVYLQSSG